MNQLRVTIAVLLLVVLVSAAAYISWTLVFNANVPPLENGGAQWSGKSFNEFEKVYGACGRSIGSGFLIYEYRIHGTDYYVWVLYGRIDAIEEQGNEIKGTGVIFAIESSEQ